MPVFRILFVLFITVPLVEIYILMQVGGLLGVMPTIVLCVLTAVIGAFLLRFQGLQTIARVQFKLEHGEIPATDLLAGIILLVCGALLLTPGFFTDCIGFLCLIPKFRNYLAIGVVNQWLRKNVHSANYRTVTLDGEYWEEDENKHLK